MIQLRYAILGDAANRTAQGRANVLGIFGSLSGPEFPLVLARCSMAVAFLGEMSDVGRSFHFEGGIWTPESEVMSAISGEFEMAAGVAAWPEHLLTCDFEELTFLEPGIYSLRFRWGEELLPDEFGFSMPLPVVLPAPGEDKARIAAKLKARLKDEWRSGKKWISGG